MSKTKKPFKKLKKTRPTENEKIKSSILRNSQRGYFTRIPIMAYKFENTYTNARDIVGELLSDESVEAYHDNNGEMKVCAAGQTFKILHKTKKKTNFERNLR